MTDLEDPFPPGTRVGSLVLVRPLGRGAHGNVHLAHDARLGRDVVLKVFSTHGLVVGGDMRARFLNEARMAAQLKGPHVVRLYHAQRLPAGYLGLVYEYVEGGTLADRLAGGARLSPAETARAADQLLGALEEGAAQGIVHCDLKPANVLLEPGGAVKLTDFGQAALVGLRRGGSGAGMPGSPAYLAPEVLAGDAPSHRSDLWALGVLLYRYLAGFEPFQADDPVGLFFAIQYQAPPPLPSSVPAAWAALLARLLAKRPEGRPTSATEARRALQTLAERGGRPTAGPDLPPDLSSLLVGRDEEVRRLDAALRGLASDRGAAVALLGEAGLGKSALVAVARRLAQQADLDVLEVGFASGEGLWRGLARALRERARRGRPLALLSPERGEPVSRVLRVLLGEAGAGESADHKDQALWALETLLEALLAERRLLLVAEDLHLAAAGDLALLREAVRRLSARPLLFLGTARTGSEAGGPGAEPALASLAVGGSFPLTDRVELAPLGRDAVDGLLTQATGGLAPAPEVLAHLARQGGGNPLWTLELLRHLESAGAVQRRAGELVPGPTFGRVGVPTTFRELVATRFRALEPGDRALVEIAAVDGIDFDGQAVAEVSGRGLLEVLRRLQEVARATGLFGAGPQGIRFAHALLRDALYEDLLPEYRRALHRALAEGLEARGRGPDPERIGTHWERGGESEKASPHLLAAALTAAQRQEHARTIDLCERGGLTPGRITSEQALRHADLLLMVVHAYAGAGRQADRDEVLARLDQAGQEAGNEQLQLRASVERSFFRFYALGAPGLDVPRLERALVALPSSKSLGYAHYLLGLRAKYAGELDAARARFQAAERTWTHEGLEGFASSAVDQLASVALRAGDTQASIALYESAAQLSERAGRRANGAISRVNALLARADLGDGDGMVDALGAAVRTLRLEGMHQHALHVAVHQARAQVADGDLVGARALLDDILAESRVARYRPALRGGLMEHVRLLAAMGEPAAAEALRGELQALCEQDAGHVDALAACRLLRLWTPPATQTEEQQALEDLIRIPPHSISGPHRIEMAQWLLEISLRRNSPPWLGQVIGWLAPEPAGAASVPVDALRILDLARALAVRPADSLSVGQAAQRVRQIGTYWNRSLRDLAAVAALLVAAREAGDATAAARLQDQLRRGEAQTGYGGLLGTGP